MVTPYGICYSGYTLYCEVTLHKSSGQWWDLAAVVECSTLVDIHTSIQRQCLHSNEAWGKQQHLCPGQATAERYGGGRGKVKRGKTEA